MPHRYLFKRLTIRHISTHFENYFLTYFAIMAVLVSWEIIIKLFAIPGYLLPPPSDIFKRFFATPSLLYHASITLREVFLGFSLGFISALILAICIVQSRTFEKIFYPVIVLLQSFPKEALSPLFVIWLGYGIAPKVVIAALISFFPLFINTVKGLRSVDPLSIDLMVSMAASGIMILRKLRFPTALPFIFAGTKSALLLSVVGAIVGEFVGASAGLGHVIIVANSQLSIDLLFAALFILCLIGIILIRITDMIEKRVLYWTNNHNSY